MPNVFLSPSTQDYNLYVTGNNEEYYMNLVVDAMEPYLTASGITFDRNDPQLTVGGSVRLSNAGNYDVHLALHSNAAPASLTGRIQGTDVYYYRGSAAGEALAQLIAANMRTIYPYPDLVGTTPTTDLYELRSTRAPAVLVEVAYHDNLEDAEWIAANINAIARVMVLSLTQYFGIPFVEPDTVQRGVVDTDDFSVYIRSGPSFSSEPLGVVPNGAGVIITGRAEDWLIVDYNGVVGYVNQGYIRLL